MIFDTDVCVWELRGNARAARVIDQAPSRMISMVTYLELLQGARNEHEVKQVKNLLTSLGFRLLPLTETIGHRASIYMEEYGLIVALNLGDVLIAATAVEANEQLVTGNDKHYRIIKDIDLVQFRP